MVDFITFLVLSTPGIDRTPCSVMVVLLLIINKLPVISLGHVCCGKNRPCFPLHPTPTPSCKRLLKQSLDSCWCWVNCGQQWIQLWTLQFGPMGRAVGHWSEALRSLLSNAQFDPISLHSASPCDCLPVASLLYQIPNRATWSWAESLQLSAKAPLGYSKVTIS